MYALHTSKHTARRQVLVEKFGYFIDIISASFGSNHFSLYDTVEVMRGNKTTVGLLWVYSYRMGGEFRRRERHTNNIKIVGREKDRKKIFGYTNVGIIIGSKLSDININAFNTIDDDVENRLYVQINPCKIVLIEKNIVATHMEIRNRAFDDIFSVI